MSSEITPTNSEDYTVAWIAALPHERAAGEMMLDHEYAQPKSFTKNVNDPNRYSWGRIGEHLVVIASLPAGEYGTTSTAITAQGLRSSLPHIRVGLLVGIGAGIPGEKCDVDGTVTVRRDIRLGDVVVSSPDGTNAGVVQYDLVKAKSSFERKGSLNSPPLALSNALSALQAKHEYQDPKIPSIISGTLEKYPKAAPKYRRPAERSDRLFRACCSHTGVEDCGNCNQAGQIQRDPREDSQVHYGTIACGNTLVKSAAYRDEIVSWLCKENVDPLCFEMEAAGLMNAFPCLVIRGICDYGDSHKNDAWQRYAAMVAAAFAKEYLGLVDVEEVRRAPDLHKVLGDIESKLDDTIEGTQRIQSTLQSVEKIDQRARIVKWLSPSDPSANYNEALRQRHEGTGRWFLQSKAFEQWKRNPRSFLWLHGIPGCGKTVLSSTIIECLKQDMTSRLLVYFYFDFNGKNKQSLDNLLRSLVEQIYQSQPQSRRPLEQLWASCGQGSQEPSTSSLKNVLEVVLSGAGSVTIILDALDESKPRHEILAWLKTLAENTSIVCQLLVTARREEDIESALQCWTHPEDRVPIQQNEVNKDISAYVKNKVRNGDDLKRWRSRPDLQEEIEVKLMKKADGMPLRIEELVDAIAVQPDARPSFDPNNRMPEPRDILRICSSLVVCIQRPYKYREVEFISADNNNQDGEMGVAELQLAHFSVKEYLVSDRITSPFSNCLADGTTRASLATLCLAYFSDLDHSLSPDKLQARFAFSQYCARYWTGYAKVVDGDDERLQVRILEFLSDRENGYLTCYNLYDPEQPWSSDNTERKTDKPACLYYTSLIGLVTSVGALLDKGADVNAQGGDNGNALQAASYEGHDEIVQMLSEQIKLLRCSSKLEDNPSPSKKRRRGLTAEDAAKKFKAAAYGYGI
ncbi:Pfs, NACHT and ankyrin domain protein, partial [Aureobasidium melanogenum]